MTQGRFFLQFLVGSGADFPLSKYLHSSLNMTNIFSKLLTMMMGSWRLLPNEDCLSGVPTTKRFDVRSHGRSMLSLGGSLDFLNSVAITLSGVV